MQEIWCSKNVRDVLLEGRVQLGWMGEVLNFYRVHVRQVAPTFPRRFLVGLHDFGDGEIQGSGLKGRTFRHHRIWWYVRRVSRRHYFDLCSLLHIHNLKQERIAINILCETALKYFWCRDYRTVIGDLKSKVSITLLDDNFSERVNWVNPL